MKEKFHVGNVSGHGKTKGWLVGEFMEELLHSDSVGIAYKVLNPGDFVELHHHDRSTEYIIVITGEYPVKVGGKNIVLKQGDFIVIPPFISLEWRLPTESNPVTVVVVRSPAVNDKKTL